MSRICGSSNQPTSAKLCPPSQTFPSCTLILENVWPRDVFNVSLGVPTFARLFRILRHARRLFWSLRRDVFFQQRNFKTAFLVKVSVILAKGHLLIDQKITTITMAHKNKTKKQNIELKKNQCLLVRESNPDL